MLSIISHDWAKNLKLIPPKINTTFYIDIIPSNIDSNNIYIQVEPESIIRVKDYLISNWRNFKYIITFNQEVLDSCPNAREYIHGTVWITQPEYSSINVNSKQFRISTIVGNKNLTDGHRLRHQLLNNEKLFPSIEFFVSIIPPPTTLKNLLAKKKQIVGPSKFKTFQYFQFQVVIENSRQTNYFTEKLMDCLITKTIPIYWGCPNISKFFDTTGWIIFDDLSDLKFKLGLLTPEYYSSYENVINSNFQRCLEYVKIGDNINKTLRSLNDY
jgi:hypothetical protein